MNRYLWIGLTATLFVLLVVHAGAAPTEVHEDAVASQDETSADIESPIGKSTAVGGIAALRVRRSKKGGGYGCSSCGYVPIRTGGCGTGRCGGGGGGYSNAQSSSTGSASSGTYGRKK
ncbi:uncharacterized protein LOC126280605 [Schistocerca gregaria]|uniref:uncharacterized protein LOC126280605 n=1 Tax=Schistocerca gregaria TaxID=7010 RepID=UPI00211E3446|nr:uncharacterized protein LOC126280605 [Schistocerca gregaria]